MHVCVKLSREKVNELQRTQLRLLKLVIHMTHAVHFYHITHLPVNCLYMIVKSRQNR